MPLPFNKVLVVDRLFGRRTLYGQQLSCLGYSVDIAGCVWPVKPYIEMLVLSEPDDEDMTSTRKALAAGLDFQLVIITSEALDMKTISDLPIYRVASRTQTNLKDFLKIFST